MHTLAIQAWVSAGGAFVIGLKSSWEQSVRVAPNRDADQETVLNFPFKYKELRAAAKAGRKQREARSTVDMSNVKLLVELDGTDWEALDWCCAGLAARTPAVLERSKH
jgi:hypothetical protein